MHTGWVMSTNSIYLEPNKNGYSPVGCLCKPDGLQKYRWPVYSLKPKTEKSTFSFLPWYLNICNVYGLSVSHSYVLQFQHQQEKCQRSLLELWAETDMTRTKALLLFFFLFRNSGGDSQTLLLPATFFNIPLR